MVAPAGFNNTLAAFFDRHPLAESAVYTPDGGNSVTIHVHYMDQPEKMELVRARYNGAQAVAKCKSSDVPSAGRGDTLYVRETTHQVIEVEPDGAGTTKLILSAAEQHG